MLEKWPKIPFDIELHILSNNVANELVIGRDFLEKEKITLIYTPSKVTEILNSQFLSHFNVCEITDKITGQIENCQIDFTENIRNKLVKLLVEAENADVTTINDDYAVRVNLRDRSIYAYALRRFTLEEKRQIREIVDDLLKRGIIKPSNSPYCARLVPVRKRNSTLRLCVDLRPLNNRVIKQKFPFPLIEDCIANLGNKSVFTVLDLKDGFHHIKVHAEDTKYFSFATSDGQYEYNYLPFGFSESPAEFQKRLINILQPLIQQNKVIVYVDDIMIATNSVDQNLEITKETLLILKKYGFKFNYKNVSF